MPYGSLKDYIKDITEIDHFANISREEATTKLSKGSLGDYILRPIDKENLRPIRKENVFVISYIDQDKNILHRLIVPLSLSDGCVKVMAACTEREADDWQIRDTAECADSLRELLTETLQIIITPDSAAYYNQLLVQHPNSKQTMFRMTEIQKISTKPKGSFVICYSFKPVPGFGIHVKNDDKMRSFTVRAIDGGFTMTIHDFPIDKGKKYDSVDAMLKRLINFTEKDENECVAQWEAQNKAEEEKVSGKPVLMRAQTPPGGLSFFTPDQDPVRRCDELKEQKRLHSQIR